VSLLAGFCLIGDRRNPLVRLRLKTAVGWLALGDIFDDSPVRALLREA
jgi:hypothetical protein